MRGDARHRVTLWIERKDAKDAPASKASNDAKATRDALMRFDLIRDLIRVESVESRLLDKGVGYLQVKQFSGAPRQDVEEAMSDLEAQGAKGWILDLRWNPGGLLEQAIKVSDLFVDKGTIVTTVGGREREARRADRQGTATPASRSPCWSTRGSASASEIVAGALKNLDRAVIIGTHTFGKGSVQVLYDNEDGSKLKLTIAQYLTPGDRSIQ